MQERGLKICIGQVDVTPGQPAVNTSKMLDVIAGAKRDGADLVVFPEMIIPGYIIGDMWERPDFLEDCEACGEKIIAASEGLTIAFGNIKTVPRYNNEDGRVRKYNSCYIAQKGQLVTIVTKTLQPNYREFDDNRHFYDKRKQLVDAYLKMSLTNEHVSMKFRKHGFEGEEINQAIFSFVGWMDKAYKPIEVNGLKLGFLLCEDSWDTDYTFSPIDILAPKCDVVFNLSCSPFTMGKNNKRNRIFSEKAIRHKTPIVYVNNVGIQNNGKTIYTFDGNSCIYDCKGKIKIPFDNFEEADTTIFLNIDEEFEHSDQQIEGVEILHESLHYGIKKFTEQLGIKRVVIGASGGIDSAVVAALFSEVISPKNLYLVNMPSQFNSQTTKDLAKDLANNLGCNYNVIPIGSSIELTRRQLQDQGFEVDSFTFENIQARDRSARVLAAISASVGGVFTCNANKSEITVGYTTLYGDLSGFASPIGDLFKTQVYELGEYINRINSHPVIPKEIFHIKPSAELSGDQNIDKGMGDPLKYEYHDKLFWSWIERWERATPCDILQWYIDGVLEKELNIEFSIVDTYFKGDKQFFIDDLERWWNLYDGFAYAKRIQSPPIFCVSRRSFGFDLRESQTKPFYSQKYCKLKKEIIK
jgi:NAD+ synthase (glutamine-hydrolysing)